MPSKKLSFEELDDAQQAIVNTLNGPVVIYAGAGSGKTRALTHRIANGVSNNIYDPEKVLALSFTTRAADEMALRLSAMGIRNVATRTFHSAALRQLKYFWPDAIGGQMPVIVENKYKVLNLALPESRNRNKEFISVIENAKTNRLNPDSLTNLDHAHAYQSYIDYLDKNNLIDFEDVLMLLVAILEDRPDLLAEVHRAYEWFSVDEYQDVNPLQQALLDLWLGENDNICVVGDLCQTIYSFAGANNKYLQEFTDKFPEASVFKLNRNYRSSAEIVEFANNLLVQMPNQKSNVGQLFATRDQVEKVKVTSFPSENEEAQSIVDEISKLIDDGIKLKDIAVLSRTNIQLEKVAIKLEEKNINYSIQTSEKYSLRTRLEEKITLASIHATKGLEWNNLFLMGVSDDLIPFIQADSQEEILEELRLFYVAVTRAKDKLFISWPKIRDSDGKERIISRFMTNFQRNEKNVSDNTNYSIKKIIEPAKRDLIKCKICKKPLVTGSEVILKRCKNCPGILPEEYLEAAFNWRKDMSIQESVPEFLVFSNATLEAFTECIYEAKVDEEFLSIPGVDLEKFNKYFDELSTILAQVEPRKEKLVVVDKNSSVDK
ncbi:MAG: hypothetical protein RLZZ37_263 [Actinomycetota bacterium]